MFSKSLISRCLSTGLSGSKTARMARSACVSSRSVLSTPSTISMFAGMDRIPTFTINQASAISTSAVGLVESVCSQASSGVIEGSETSESDEDQIIGIRQVEALLKSQFDGHDDSDVW